MAKRLKEQKEVEELKEVKIQRPPRRKLSAQDALKRTQEFEERKEKFIAAIREGKGRSVYP